LKSLLLLWQRTATDAAVQCRTSAIRDIKRVSDRVEHEGIGVLTLFLPDVGKAFERSLDSGQVTDDLLSLCGKRAGFPELFRDFLRLVFDRDGGRLLDNPSVDAIQAVRQLSLMFGKLLHECSDTRVEQAFAGFIRCEQEVRDSQLPYGSDELRHFRRLGSMLFGNVFSKIDRDVFEGNIVGKHGPGATADKLKGNFKFRQTEWTYRLEDVFPATEHIIPSFRYYQSLDELDYLDLGAERPVKVIAVPKTLKTPRIIAIEPTCMQFMQQGLMEKFVTYLESDLLVRDMIGFTDQTPNQRMACEGSLSGELATLDLSEASDRVSLQHVSWLTSNWRHLLQAVTATRSIRADVPGHGVIPLAKYASMGSALTFPMEECVFLTCIFYGIEQALRRRLTEKDVKSFSGRVRVYGDDIIVPVEFVESVIGSLTLFGFKVNHNKSFFTGRFRESCGKEYFDGHDVSIFRVRRDIPFSRSDVPGVVSTVSLRNQAYWAGYWGTADYLDQLLGSLIPFPMVGVDSPVLGRHSVLGYAEERICPRLHNSQVRGYVVTSQIPASVLEDEWALLKCFLKRGDEPFADKRHLERQGRPVAVNMKLGWYPSH